MANICMVSVKITGPKSQIQTLETELQTAANNTYYEKNWLGNLWMHLGHTFSDVMNGVYGSCRGTICDISLTKPNEITIEMDCAWQPHLKPIKDFVTTYAPKAKIEFEAEEPGCELFVTSKSNINTVRVDLLDDIPKDENWIFDWEGEHYKDELQKTLSNKLGKSDTLEKLAYEFEDERPYVAFRFFEHADIDDYC